MINSSGCLFLSTMEKANDLLASNPAEATAVDRIKVLLFFIG
jgi:hypothetical protein